MGRFKKKSFIGRLSIRLARSKEEKQKIRTPLGIFRYIQAGDRRHQNILQVNLFRLNIALLVLAGVFYIVSAISLFAWRARIPHNQIGFLDILLPTRWHSLSDKQGQTKIAQGLAQYESGEFQKSLFSLRSGLIRHPQHFDARLKVAKIYQSSGMLEPATDLLKDGLQYGFPDDRNYLDTMLQIGQFIHHAEFLRDVSKKLLQFDELNDDLRLKIEIYSILFKALQYLRDPAGIIEASEAIREDDDLNPNLGFNLNTEALVHLKRYDEALENLNNLPFSIREGDAQYGFAKTRVFLASGQLEKAKDAYIQFFEKQRTAWQPQARLVVQFHELSKNTAKAKQEFTQEILDSYINRHQGNREALTEIMAQFTDLPCSEQLIHCIDKIMDHGETDVSSYRFLLVQAYLSEGKWKQARNELIRIKSDFPDDSQDRHYYIWLQTLIEGIITQDKGKLSQLEEHIRQRIYEPEVYTESIQALIRTAQFETAQSVANHALKIYPYSIELNQLRSDAIESIQSEEKNWKNKVDKSISDTADS